MLEFKTIEELKPNPSIIDTIKTYTYKTINGKIKVLKNTNLKFIKPIEYLITYPVNLNIYEYKIEETSNKPFYIKEHSQKYSLTEILNILKKI